MKNIVSFLTGKTLLKGLDSEDGFGGPSASGFDFDEYDMDMGIE